jgi:hypothetical protein
MNIKPKDFFLFKVRSYASPYLMKKGLDYEPTRKAHYDVARRFVKFEREFLKKILNKTEEQLYEEYKFCMSDSAFEDVKEIYNIFKFEAGSHKYYAIPITYDCLIEDVKFLLKENELVWNQLQRFRYFFYIENHFNK